MPVVRVLPHPGCADRPAARTRHRHRLRPDPGHHRPRHPGRSADHPVRLEIVDRGHLRRGPRHPRRRPGPQPHRERGTPHRPVRPVLLRDHRHLVHPVRPPSVRRRRPSRTGPLVHRQDRARLRRHGHQAAPRDHRRPLFRHPPRQTHRRRNPSRSAGLGPSRTRPRRVIISTLSERRKSSQDRDANLLTHPSARKRQRSLRKLPHGHPPLTLDPPATRR